MSNTPINLEWMLSQDEDTVELTCPLSELEYEIPPGLDVDSLFNESLVPENTQELNMDGGNGDDDDPFDVHCRRFHSERCDGYTHAYLCAAPVRGERSQDMLFCTQGEQCPIYVAQQIEERLEATSTAIPDPCPPSTPEWACEDAGFFKDLDIDQIIACCTDATAPTSTEKINEIIPVEVAIGDPLQLQHATTSSGIQSTIAPIDQNYQFDDSSIQKIFISHDLQPITQAELEAVLSALHGISETQTPCPLPPSPPSLESSSSAKKRRAPSSHDQPPQKRNRVELLHQIGGREPQPGSSGLQQVCSTATVPPHMSDDSDDSIVDIQNAFEILSERSEFNRRFKITGRKITFRLIPRGSGQNPYAWLEHGIAGILSHLKRTVSNHDMISVAFMNPQFQSKPAWVSYRRADQLSVDVIMHTIERLLQSNVRFFSDDALTLAVSHVSMPSGTAGGGIRLKNVTYAEYCKSKRSIIPINNTDGYCLPRAIVTGIAHVERNPVYDDLRRGRLIQKQQALELCENSNVIIPPEGCGIRELHLFQNYLRNYKITVYEYNIDARKPYEIIFKGGDPTSTKFINLLYKDGHFNLITSLTGAFSMEYFCHGCHTPYDTAGFHNCDASCPRCEAVPPCSLDMPRMECKDCRRDFRGMQCYLNHKTAGPKGGKSVCSRIKQCNQCNVLVHGNRRHVCGEVYCRICETFATPDHRCYIKRCTSKQNHNKNLFIFYDFETRQEDPLTDGSVGFKHVPTHCVLQQACHRCMDSDDVALDCSHCGKRQHIFTENPVSQLIAYVTRAWTKFKTITCIAHNARGFDAHFILKHIVEELGANPDLLMRGNLVLSITLNRKLRFIDSLNFLPMGLSKLPEAFNLPAGVKKGHFPHFFNTLANSGYVGQIPDAHYYGADMMQPSERREFLTWHAECRAQNVVFNFARDIVEYCTSDVDILRRACLKFRQVFLQETGTCPLLESITIASACNLVFRKKFLKPDTISIIPPNGYRWRDMQSIAAIKWLTWVEHEKNVVIQHAGRGPEKRLRGGFKADGYHKYENGEEHIWSFLGCFYHGHTCLSADRNRQLYDKPSDTLAQRLERTETRTRRLRESGYIVEEKWECEFNNELKANPEMREFLTNHPMTKKEPLQPRDAFFGGRTENSCMYYKCDTTIGETIQYLDVCSLYPYICKYFPYPVGHPKILVGEECRELLSQGNGLEKVEGLVKCTVLPPRNLFFPVLPVRMNDKLMFLLCRTCGEQKVTVDCTHDNHLDRTLSGTWVSAELKKAVEMGYVITTVHEIWQYSVTCYDPRTGTGGLFSDYINVFLKAKMEASGYPTQCVSEDAKIAYVRECLEKEGVQLDMAQISVNPGRRSLAKLMLNSFWGKFGQREDRTSTKVVNEPFDLYELLTDPSIEVNAILPVGETAVYVNSACKKESVMPLKNVNTVIAAYTTAGARLELYKLLEKLGRRVLYYDTDSVIFTHMPGEYKPETGNFLGCLTDELTPYGEGSYIMEFVSGGPKNYAFKVYSTRSQAEESVMKVKGITLNHSSRLLVNFDSLKNMVVNNSPPVHVLNPSKIVRTSDHTIISRPEQKEYRVVNDKRRITQDYNTLPYGYLG